MSFAGEEQYPGQEQPLTEGSAQQPIGQHAPVATAEAPAEEPASEPLGQHSVGAEPDPSTAWIPVPVEPSAAEAAPQHLAADDEPAVAADAPQHFAADPAPAADLATGAAPAPAAPLENNIPAAEPLGQHGSPAPASALDATPGAIPDFLMATSAEAPAAAPLADDAPARLTEPAASEPAPAPEIPAAASAAVGTPADAVSAVAPEPRPAADAPEPAHFAPADGAGAEAVPADLTAAPAPTGTPGDDVFVAPQGMPADVTIVAPMHAPGTGETTEDLGDTADLAEGATSPEDTAEIDVEAIEVKLNDPGTTMSFEGIPEERIDANSTYDAGATTTLAWGARTDVGCVRAHNEDSYLVQSPLFCVCDGMGGHAAGEVASSIAVETIARMAPHTADAAMLASAVEAANAAVIEAAAHGRGKPGMGCTATTAYIDGHSLAIAHVGDSRAYLLHEGTLIRVTHDHSFVEELVDAGEITADEARVHPNRSVITRALGSDPAMYADHFMLNIDQGDRLVLCSDGLSGMVPDREIERVATESETPQLAADNLVDAALAAGGADNVTVVVVDVVDDGRMKEIRRKRRRNIAVAAGAIAALFLAVAVGFFCMVSSSVYLGVKDGAVAIYTGIPSAPLGLTLHWLEDETSVQIKDLPEDTQNRLAEGISQPSLDEAARTVERYREQIEEQVAKEQATAQRLQEQKEATEKAEAEKESEKPDKSGKAASDNAKDDKTEQSSNKNAGGAA